MHNKIIPRILKLKRSSLSFLLTLFLFPCAFLLADESLTLTAYYPSPYGSYNQLTTTGNTYLATSFGSVGIGTSSPTGKLNVVSSGGAGQGVQIDNREIKFRGDGDAHYSIFANRVAGTLTIEDTSSNYQMSTAGTLGIAIKKTSGNVGIGTENPSTKLQVAGTAIRTIAYNQGYGIDTTCDVNSACGPSALAARTLSFTKTSASTKVRVEYQDTMRSYGGDGTARCCYWEIRFNGSTCPGGAIKGNVYSEGAKDPHHVRNILGYCSGLAAGAYTIQVYVGGCGAYQARCYTGWDGTTNWFLEAEEVN